MCLTSRSWVLRTAPLLLVKTVYLNYDFFEMKVLSLAKSFSWTRVENGRKE